MVTGYLQRNPNADDTMTSDDGQLAEMILGYREQFGDEVFGKSLQIALSVTKHPFLIDRTEVLYRTKNPKNLSKYDAEN